jgi:P27 family predicted phage terminase small subunit
MPGRRPKPTALHRLHGTYHTGKHGRDRAGEPIAEGDLIEPPPDLTDSQQAGWQYAVAHMPKGIVKMIDRGMLKIWVEAEDRHNTARMMQALLDTDTKLKLLVKGPNGLEASPYCGILDKAAKTMFRAASELGFSPAARPRLKVTIAGSDAAPDPGRRADPWSTLKVIPGGKTA